MDESSARFHGEEYGLTINCDHRRALVELEVRSPSLDRSNQILSEIVDLLNLKRVAEDPYRYRKSAATYKVGYANKKSFVDSTRVLLEKFYGGQKPATAEAFITKTIDNIEILQGFFDVDTFLDFIEGSDEADFDWANLTVEGANGIAIGMSLNKKDRLFEIRSNISGPELNETVKEIYEPLHLRLIKGSSKGSDVKRADIPQEEKWWIKYSTQILIAVFASAIVWARAYYTSYDLKISNPLTSPAEVTSPEVSISWYLWPNDVLFHDPDYKAFATIVVSHNGKEVNNFDKELPPYNVHLNNGEGDYIIEVRPYKKAPPGIIVVTYKPKSPGETSSR